MAEMKQCEFFLLRYVPDAVKDEFVNIGLVLVQPQANGSGAYADVRFTRDWRRVRCLDADADLEMLQALEADIRSQLGGGDREALLHRLEDSFSNIVQISDPKACLAADPKQEIESLAKLYLEAPSRGKRVASGRQVIVGRMRDAFQQARVWELMRKSIPAAAYTHKGDPLKIDCGYKPNGVVRLFQAVSLQTDPDAAKVLAFSYPALAAGIQRVDKAQTELTAIVEDELDHEDEAVEF